MTTELITSLRMHHFQINRFPHCQVEDCAGLGWPCEVIQLCDAYEELSEEMEQKRYRDYVATENPDVIRAKIESLQRENEELEAQASSEKEES